MLVWIGVRCSAKRNTNLVFTLTLQSQPFVDSRHPLQCTRAVGWKVWFGEPHQQQHHASDRSAISQASALCLMSGPRSARRTTRSGKSSVFVACPFLHRTLCVQIVPLDRLLHVVGGHLKEIRLDFFLVWSFRALILHTAKGQILCPEFDRRAFLRLEILRGWRCAIVVDIFFLPPQGGWCKRIY